MLVEDLERAIGLLVLLPRLLLDLAHRFGVGLGQRLFLGVRWRRLLFRQLGAKLLNLLGVLLLLDVQCLNEFAPPFAFYLAKLERLMDPALMPFLSVLLCQK